MLRNGKCSAMEKIIKNNRRRKKMPYITVESGTLSDAQSAAKDGVFPDWPGKKFYPYFEGYEKSERHAFNVMPASPCLSRGITVETE